MRGKALPRGEFCSSPTVLTLDPGGTTGWSIMGVHPEALLFPDVPILSNVEHWSSGQLVGPEIEQAEEIVDIVEDWPGIAVVLESFVLRQQHVDLAPVRITSMVDYALWHRHLQSFKQTPAEAKNTATDARLKSWGFYKREGGMEHARDADRHALTFLRKCKERLNLRVYAWPHLYGKQGEYAEEQASLAREAGARLSASGRKNGRHVTKANWDMPGKLAAIR